MKEGGQNEMTLICKKNALYVKACVIANGIADTDGDILNTQEIKEIFTSFNNQDSFEVHHNDLPLQEVSLLENYISQTDETLGLMTIPSGSWMIVIRVDNPNIQERILQGEFGGVSLSNRVKSECSINLTGEVRYKDLPKMDCVIPRFISFVGNPANRIGLHIYDYDTYIRKSKKEKPVMDMKEFIDGLKALISKVEDEEPAEAEVEKSDEEPKEEEEADAVETVEDETETSEEETPKIKKEESKEEEVDEESSEDEETTVEKEEEADVTLEERVAKLEEQIAKLLETEEESADEETSETQVEEVEAEAEESPKITKSRKVIKTDAKIRTKNFYEIRGRDPVTGCKIRK